MTSLLLRLFVKDWENTGSTAVRSRYGKFSGIVGIVCNVFLCIAKFLIGMLSGAVSIAADAVNNLSDAASSVVTLLGFKLSEKPADEEHPFGYARVEYLSGLAVAALILVIGVLLVISSAKKLFSPAPESVAFSWVLVIVLVLSIAVKLWMALFNTKLGKKINSAALLATAADSRNDVISTGAVLLACIAGAIIKKIWSLDIGGYIDGGMGILVAAFIIWSGFGIAKDTISPLLGESNDPELVELVKEHLSEYDKILGSHDLIVHDYGPGQRFATVHVEMDSKIPPLEAHDLIDNIEMDFRSNHNVQLVIHYDPVVTDDEKANVLKQKLKTAMKAIDAELLMHDFRVVYGQTHTNLVFDLVIPRSWKGREKALQAQLEAAMQTDEMKYYLVITYDDAAFNRMRWDGGKR